MQFQDLNAQKTPDGRGLLAFKCRTIKVNPRDYKLWAVLEDMACQKCHINLDSLKRSLMKAAAEIPLETVHAAIAEWPEHLKACIEAEGGHFEWRYYK